MPLLNRRRQPTRALVASARTLQVGNERDALSIRRTRQPWQPAAWTYRDSIGEIGYAMRFLANSLSRMRLYAAAYDDPMDNPVPVDEAKNVADDVAKLANACIAELGAGQLALAGIIKPLVENMEVGGECYIVSDPAVITDQLWSIRSMDEIQVLEDGEFLLRDDPDQKAGIMPQGRPLSPNAYVARMWTPHPRFHAWADSPMRQLIDPSDELLLLSRSIRGIARSRLTGPGILAVAEELSLKRNGPQETDDDPLADQFMRELTETMMEPISDEGSAAAVVPIVIRGPYDMIKDGIQHFSFDRLFDDKAVELRGELIGRIATGLDLPKEVIVGTADLNHWSAWQVDDSTFRHHLEPKVLTMVDCLTVAYLRPWLLAAGVDQDTVDRLVVWYDPTELVTHPDRTADALQVWDRFGISSEVLRKEAGWSEDDAPPIDELLLRMLAKERTFPPTIVEALFNHFAPQLRILPDKNEPGVGPGDATEPPDATAPAQGDLPQPAGAAPAGEQQPQNPGQTPGQTARAITVTAAAGGYTVVNDAAPVTRESRRAGRRLMSIDRSLRDRLLAACDAAVRRTLERAGNKARAKLTNAVRHQVSGVPAGLICAQLGREQLAEFGLDEENLIDDTFSTLFDSWTSWVDDANRAALTTITTLTGLPVDSPVIQNARRKQERQAGEGWQALLAAITVVAHSLLFNPHPEAAVPATSADSGSVLVPAGIIRNAVAVAGGGAPGAAERSGAQAVGWITGDGSAAPVPGITSGPIAAEIFAQSGSNVAGYEWVHGDTTAPYIPHLDLDGLPFTDWLADPALQPGDSASWQGIGNFFPGDHDGCRCDVIINWTTASGGPDSDVEG